LRRRRIGFVFQAFNLLDVLTAQENVALPLELDGQGEALDRAGEALTLVGLSKRRTHFPNQLSGGEQQRVAMARALVMNPLLLLADEPTGNLDSSHGDQVMALLRSLADDRGQTIVMVTHNASHAALSDRLIHLRDGCIVEEQSLGRCRPHEPRSA
jgi:putative ABC transport system ATP-binding protein